MILLILSILFGLAFFYPYLIYPVMLKAFVSKPWRTDGKEHQYSMAMLFCAYNEGDCLKEKITNIQNILELRPELKIYVYSDGSTDATNELLGEMSDFATIVEGERRIGKAAGMAQLVSLVKEEILVFTDANVLVPPGSVQNIDKYFYDDDVGTVAGKLMYVNGSDSETATTSGAYWRMEEVIKEEESRTGSTMGADGSIFAIRKELYPIVPINLLDDLIASINPIFSGRRVICGQDILAYEKSVTSSREEYSRKKRIACRAFSTHLHIWPSLRRAGRLNLFKYVSHKLVRWFGIYEIAASVLFFGLWILVGFGATAFCCFLGLLGIFAACIALSKNRYALIVREVLLGIFATGVGVFEALKGKSYQTWSPAASRS